MDAFETIVAMIFNGHGWWVKESVKVDISKADKQKIGTPSMPRPEIDLVVYKPSVNLLMLLEVKSYLDSPGVKYSDITDSKKGSDRYKLFTNSRLRAVVTQRILHKYKESGLISTKIKIGYGLVAGKVYSNDEEKINKYFVSKGWKFFGPQYVYDALEAFADRGWENNIVTVAAKCLRRKFNCK